MSIEAVTRVLKQEVALYWGQLVAVNPMGESNISLPGFCLDLTIAMNVNFPKGKVFCF